MTNKNLLFLVLAGFWIGFLVIVWLVYPLGDLALVLTIAAYVALTIVVGIKLQNNPTLIEMNERLRPLLILAVILVSVWTIVKGILLLSNANATSWQRASGTVMLLILAVALGALVHDWNKRRHRVKAA